MQKRAEELGVCVYCGVEGPLTNDHIPPKCLFAKPRPNNLITVKSCSKCNLSMSNDDEYFKTMLSLRDINYEHPDAKAICPSVFRSLNKTSKKYFLKYILQNTKRVNLKTKSGLNLGYRLAYNVDLKRLGMVVERIVRGLFVNETGGILPKEALVSVWNEDGLSFMGKNHIKELQDTIVTPVTKNELHVIGTNTFTYQFALDSDKKWASAWILRFYEKTSFLAITLPPGNDIA